MKKLLFVAVISSMLSACTNTGIIEGVSDGKSIQFDYEQGLFENDGQLSITMPDGERYSGKFVQTSASTSGDDWEIGEASNDDSWTINNSTTVSSHTEAMLIGNRGHTMKCQFQLSNPDFGIESGGIGSCKTSNDQKVAVSF